MSDTEIPGTDLEVVVIAENEKKSMPSRGERFHKRQQQTVTLEQDDSCDTVLREGGIDTSGMSKKEKQQLVQILQMSKEDTTQTGSWGLYKESSQEIKGEMAETNKGGDESNEEDLIEERPSKPSPLREMDFTDWLSSHKRSNSLGPPTKQTAMQVKPFMRQTAKQATKRTVSVKNENCKSDLGDREGRPMKQRKIEQFSHIVIPDEVVVDSQNQSQNCQQIYHDNTHTPGPCAMDDDTQPPDSPDIFQSQPHKDKEGILKDNKKDVDDEEATQNYDTEDLENQEQKSMEGLQYGEIKPLHRHYRKVKRKYQTRQAYYVPPEVDPRDYTKVILQLFEIYHRKLSEAQARVNTYVSWGDGIRVGRHMADSIGVWRKRNIYREDFSSDEADFEIAKPKTIVHKKSLSEDSNINCTDVGIPDKETTTGSKSNVCDLETQPFDQSYNPMEIEAEFCDDNISRPDSRSSVELKEVANVVLEQDDGMTEQRKGKKVPTDEREKCNRKTLYSESLEKFIPEDKGLCDRRWSSIINENDTVEGHALLNVNVNCSRKRRPVRLTRKREKILTKERKEPVKQCSDSSTESFPFDEIDCNTEVANLTKNQLQNTFVDRQTCSGEKSPARTRSRTQNTSQSTNSRSPGDRPPSETSITSRESLSQSSAYMLDPQGELYSTQACVLRGKLENITENKQKYVNIRTYSRRDKNRKKETDRNSRKETDHTVIDLENSDNESDQMKVNSGVPSSKSEETESSRDSTEIKFNIMQPTLIDDDVECFETKSRLEVKNSKVNISFIDDCDQAESVLPNSSSPESVDKTDSQSPDFKKSKILKKIVKCVDTESSDDVILISPKRNRSPDAEETSSGYQSPVPGPSWLKPNRRNLLTPVMETSNQDEEVGDTTGPNLGQTDQKVKQHKDKNTANFILRKRTRNTNLEEEGKEEEMHGSERELRGKKDIWSRTRKGEKNTVKETGDKHGDDETDQFEKINKSKEKEELDADQLLKDEGILLQEVKEEKNIETRTPDRRRGGRMNQDVTGGQQKTKQSKVRGENKEVDNNFNRNKYSESSGSEGKVEQSFGERKRGRGRGRKVEQQSNKRRAVEQPVDNVATNQGNKGKKRAMEEDEDVEIEIKIPKKVEEMPCPLCNKRFPLDQIEEHAAECNGDTAENDEVDLTPPNTSSNIVVTPESGPTQQKEEHHSSLHDSQSSQCNLSDGSGSLKDLNPSDVNMVTCYICDEEFAKGQEYSKHIDRCLDEAKRRQREADMRKYKIPHLTEEQRSTRSKNKASGDSLLGRLDKAWDEDHSDGYSSESNEEESQTLKDVIQSNYKYPKTKISDVSDSLDESESSYASTPDNSQSNDLLPGGWTLEELKNSPIKTYVPISAQGDSDGFLNQYSKAKARYERQMQRQESNTNKRTRGKVKKRGKKRKRKSKGKNIPANKRKRT